jgi:RimJ/RimL family protein N-acetyltransferase
MAPTAIASKYEIVSPFPEECFPAFWSWMAEFREQMVDDFSPQTFQELVAKARQDQAAGGKSYAIMQNGVVVGCVWGEHVGDRVYAGHLVFDRDSLKSAEKLEATKITLQRFFSEGARKIRWMALSDNRAYRIFLRRLGATFEGELKRETRRQGKECDVVLFASFPAEEQST